MSGGARRERGLESSLALDGEIMVLEQRLWVKIDARRVERSVVAYRYMNAAKLMVDFWNDVDRVMFEMNR